MAKTVAKILIVDDDLDVLTAARVVLRQRFEHVDTESNPERVLSQLRPTKYDVVILDMNYSAGRTSGNEGLFWLREILRVDQKMSVILITAYSDVQLAVEAMKIGASDFIVKPWTNEKLESAVEALVRSGRESDRVQSRKTEAGAGSFEIIGESTLMANLVRTAKRVAETDANVLLLGENGSGKELIAKLIHAHSHRRHRNFIKVDAGSIVPSLFESELFGHKKGSFTDAREDRIGRIQQAHQGTLFLDEIGNLPLDLQSKLLSVLQNREVIPVGSGKPVDVDIRLITATNANIHVAVDEGKFRQDLLFRINTVEIPVPALREHPEDIPLLASHFLKVYGNKYGRNKVITKSGIDELTRHLWPGNIRELQHTIERAVIMSDRDELSSSDFSFSHTRPIDNKSSLNLDEIEKKAIISAIQKYNGNMSKVAKELGVGRTTLYRKIARYGLAK